MDIQFAKKWVEALRSDKYGQTQGALYDGSYCCLGVAACLITGRTGSAAIKYAGNRESEDFARGTILGVKAAKLVGLTNDEQSKLAQLNDDGKSFRQIASFIEREYIKRTPRGTE